MRRTYRRHRNPKSKEDNTPFFSRVMDHSIQSKKDKDTFFQTKQISRKKNEVEEKESDITGKKIVYKAPDEKVREEEPVQTLRELQKQESQEEEESVQTKDEIQKQEDNEEEEPVQANKEIQKQDEEEEEEPIQTKDLVNKQDETEEDAIQAKSEQKNERSIPGLSENLNRSKGKGKPLSPILRKEMEAYFKADFRKVKIHTDELAAYMCRTLKARAFTNGYNIYFNTGQYDPLTRKGKKLLAHELTHVIQQMR